MTEGGTEDDDEQTLEEEEKMEEDPDHTTEIDNLQKEGRSRVKYSQLSLSGHHCKADTCGHERLVPAEFHLFLCN